MALKALVLSLKFRLTLVSVAALGLGIALNSVSLVGRADRDLLRAQQLREIEQSVRSAAVLARRVADYQAALQHAGAGLDRAVLGEPRRLQDYLEGQRVLRGMFSSVFFADAGGRVQVLIDEQGVHLPEMQIDDRAYFRRALSLGQAVVSEPLRSRDLGQPVVVFVELIRRNGQVQGVLAGSLRLDGKALTADLVDSVRSSDASLAITDTQGRVLAASDSRLLLGTLDKDSLHFDAALRAWRGQGAPLDPGGMQFAQPGQMVSAAGVPGPGWVVWRSLPEEVLLRPLHRARQQALIGALALMAALAVLLWMLFAWLLAPLARLSDRARTLFDGQRQDLGWPADGSEIGELARVLRHVSAERARLESVNGEVLNKLVSVLSSAPIGIAFTRRGKFELVSAEFCRLIGRSERELLGQSTRIIYAEPDRDYAALGQRVIEAFQTGQPYLGEWQMARADGSPFWAELRGRPVLASDSQAGTIWTVSDVSAQVDERETLAWSATHDLLTGLSNRRTFLHRLEQMFSHRADEGAAQLIVIDLDRFKPINDQAGHAAGDAMLKLVAAAISACVRAGDLVVRTGGDEFAVLLAPCQHPAALRIAETICIAITGIALSWNRHSLRVGASLGVAALSPLTPSVGAWLAAADEACYAAKAEGRGIVRSADRPMLHRVGRPTAEPPLTTVLADPEGAAT